MKARLYCTLFLLLSLAARASTPSLIPLPQQMQVNPGQFSLCPTLQVPGAAAQGYTTILTDSASRTNAEYLASLLFRSTGFIFPISTDITGNAVRRSILLTTANANGALGPEGYELTVAPDSVVVRAPTDAGVFYGIQTFLQLLPPEIYSQKPATNVQWVAQCVYVQDWPRFSWRGWMLDTVRHFLTKDDVKELIDSLAIHKINVFHWHLDDDAGWRIEIKKYPLLTQVGAWRSAIMFGLNPRSTTAWDDDNNYGGYYTQDDLKELVAYAAQRHITIVPEIEMPGHSTAAALAYPDLMCGCDLCGTNYSLNVTSYYGGVFCPAKPNTINFLHDVLTEVMSIFPSQYIHIGGDEVNFSNWRNHDLDEISAFNLGITNWQVYQGYFAQQMANWLQSQGRTMIGWSEIMNGGTITNTALEDWENGTLSRAAQAATNGENVVIASSATYYLNKWQTGTSAGTGKGVIWSNEPPGQSGYVPLINVYNTDPIPSTIPAAYTNFVIGVEGPCWTEYIPSLKNMEFKMYPRLSALSEVDWTLPGLKNYSSFTNRLVTHKKRLAAMKVNFNPEATPPEIGRWNSAMIATNYNELSWNITTNITQSGELDVSFCWKSGANGIDIQWASLQENGVEIDRDTHAGFTGSAPVKPAYILRLPGIRPGATYTLHAFVAGRGGHTSNGILYTTLWD